MKIDRKKYNNGVFIQSIYLITWESTHFEYIQGLRDFFCFKETVPNMYSVS